MRPVPVQMWQGEPSPGADVAAACGRSRASLFAPQCISALAKTTPEWHTELRASNEPFICSDQTAACAVRPNQVKVRRTVGCRT
jgi:hypothetical protein